MPPWNCTSAACRSARGLPRAAGKTPESADREPRRSFAPAILTAIFGVVLAATAARADVFSVSPDLPRTSIAADAEFLEDSAGELTLEDVRSEPWAARFRRPGGDRLEFGYTSSAYWLRFTLANPGTRAVDVVVELGSPQVDEITLYAPDAGGAYAPAQLGDLAPRRERELPLRRAAHPIRLAPQQQATLYARVRSTSTLSLPLHVTSARLYYSRVQQTEIWNGVILGAVTILGLYNLGLLIFTRERAYFWYVAHSAVLLGYFVTLDGYAAPLWHSVPRWQAIAIPLLLHALLLCVVQFARHYPSLVARARWQDRLLGVLSWPILLSAAALPFVAPQTAGHLTLMTTFGTAVAILAVLLDGLRRGGLPARIYSLAWVCVVLSGIYAALVTLGILGTLGSAMMAFKTSLVAERALSSLGLATVIRRLRVRGDEFAGAALTEAEERRRAELALEEREQELRQARRLEMVGQLAGGVAHDFNNLLQAILGYTELLLGRAAEGSPERSELCEVRTAAERAATLTRQLLAFSRRQVLQPIDVDFNELLRNLRGLLARVLPENIDLRFKLASPDLVVHTDVRQTEQVVINLCVNARDAMPEGGTIELETRLLEASHPRLAGKSWVVHERYGELIVRDTGEGIPPEVIDHIFEPFFTTKEANQGTGLGLATVYGIVHQHGGSIEVESEPGKGATFRVYLPVAARPVQHLDHEATPAGRGGGQLVLIAEDDERVRSLTERLLRQAGYEVVSTSNGEEALQRFEEHADEVAVVLLDVVMPRKGGVEIHQTIRSRRPEVPIVFCSGYTANLLGDELLLDPDTNFLRKPFTAGELLATLQAAVEQRSPTARRREASV